MGERLTLDAFNTVDGAFAVAGLDMRIHKGRSVVMVTVEGKTHYLKRFWLCPTQILKRQVARGFCEMGMIDWLNGDRLGNRSHTRLGNRSHTRLGSRSHTRLENRSHTRLENRSHTPLEDRCHAGFAGPRIVRRGADSVFGLGRRVFFLMEEVPDELPLEAAWRRFSDLGDELLRALAGCAAMLHDAGFCHTDFSERHILVGGMADEPQAACRRLEADPTCAWTFRLIDVERGNVGRASPIRTAADLATLTASVSDDRLRGRIATLFLDEYIAKRRTLPPNIDFRALFSRTNPTRAFH